MQWAYNKLVYWAFLESKEIKELDLMYVAPTADTWVNAFVAFLSLTPTPI